MVDVGDEMRNPLSGERFVWLATRASTQGAYCEFDLHLDAGAAVAAPHRHPHQEERFTVVSGALLLDQTGRSSRLGPGETGVIPPDVTHRWGNAADGGSHVVVRLTPALHIEDYFATFCAVATAGRATASGIPRNPCSWRCSSTPTAPSSPCPPTASSASSVPSSRRSPPWDGVWGTPLRPPPEFHPPTTWSRTS